MSWRESLVDFWFAHLVDFWFAHYVMGAAQDRIIPKRQNRAAPHTPMLAEFYVQTWRRLTSISLGILIADVGDVDTVLSCC
jgi:hypothetical protein